jgi:hypothetical protein
LSAEEIALKAAARDQESEAPPIQDGQNQAGVKKPDGRQKMTADQYLKRAPRGVGIGGLVRSLYKTHIMSFEEWENTVKTLLSKPVR